MTRMIPLKLFLILSIFTVPTCYGIHTNTKSADINLDELCQHSSGIVISILDSVTVVWKSTDTTNINWGLSEMDDNSTFPHFNSTNIRVSPLQCKVIFNLSPENGAFFIVTLKNHLPINRDRCTAWNPLMKILSPKQIFGLGCIRSSTRFFDPPISLVMNMLILRSLFSRRDTYSFTMTITAVTFDCGNTPAHPINIIDSTEDHHSASVDSSFTSGWWPCSLHERYCIQRHLFCDTINNCGSNEDEDKRLCSYWPAEFFRNDQSAETGTREDNYILQQILRKYEKARESLALTLLAPESDRALKSAANWQSVYIPILVSFFGFLLILVVACFVYVWWTKHRNQQLRRNFIDYVIKYRNTAASGGNRSGLMGLDSYPFSVSVGNAFAAAAADEALAGVEWTGEHRSLLGRRR